MILCISIPRSFVIIYSKCPWSSNTIIAQLENTAPMSQSPASLALQFQHGCGASDPCSCEWFLKSHWYIPIGSLKPTFLRPFFFSLTLFWKDMALRMEIKLKANYICDRHTPLQHVCEANRREGGESLSAPGHQSCISLTSLLHEATSNKQVTLGTSGSGPHIASCGPTVSLPEPSLSV